LFSKHDNQRFIETITKNTREASLITAATAALMAGTGLASAQGTNENRETPSSAAQ
jgi:hypothetical protein